MKSNPIYCKLSNIEFVQKRYATAVDMPTMTFQDGGYFGSFQDGGNQFNS
jgi:hypothetical protein